MSLNLWMHPLFEFFSPSNQNENFDVLILTKFTCQTFVYPEMYMLRFTDEIRMS